MTHPHAKTTEGMGELPADVQHAMNGDLCDFATRWKVDGDYLRCRSCLRPQLAGYHHMNFPHARDCLAAERCEPHPWNTLAGILRPIFTAASVASEKSE